MYIDSGIKMQYVNEFKEELTKYHIRYIAYAVKPSNPEYHINYYDDIVYSYINLAYRQKQIYNYHGPEQHLTDIREELKDYNKIKLNYDDGAYYIDGKTVNKEDLAMTLRTIAYKTENYIFILKVEENLLFHHYFIMWSSIIKGMNDLRDDLAFEEHQCSFMDLFGKKADEIANRYPIRIFEVTEENADIFETD
jgi:hypothetical protein